MRRLIASAVLLAVSTGLASAAELDEPRGVFGWRGVGEAHQITEGHTFWVGTFTGTFMSAKGEGGFMHLAAWHCPGSNDLDFNNKSNRTTGYCIFTDLDGDVGVISWSGTGDTQTVDGTSEWISGTGKYEGISGTFPWRAGIGPVNADGTTSGWTDMLGGKTMLP